MRAYSKPVGLLLFFATIALLMVPVAYTTPPTEGIGTFTSEIPEDDEVIRFAGGNMIVHHWGGGGHLYGIIEGKWIHDEWMVVHLDSGRVNVKGVWDTPDGVIFNAPGGPLYGNLHVRYSGTVDPDTGEFHGRYVIISGTGDLANLRGQGAVWMDETGGHSTLQYHFDPS